MEQHFFLYASFIHKSLKNNKNAHHPENTPHMKTWCNMSGQVSSARTRKLTRDDGGVKYKTITCQRQRTD